MSLETLLDRNKAFAATDAVAKNPKSVDPQPAVLHHHLHRLARRARRHPRGRPRRRDRAARGRRPGHPGRAARRRLRQLPDGNQDPRRALGGCESSTTPTAAQPCWPTRSCAAGFAARGGYVEAELAWLPATDPAATVRADVNTLATAPQLSPNIRISGYVYNTAVGTINTVARPHLGRSALDHSRLPSSSAPTRQCSPPAGRPTPTCSFRSRRPRSPGGRQPRRSAPEMAASTAVRGNTRQPQAGSLVSAGGFYERPASSTRPIRRLRVFT